FEHLGRGDGLPNEIATAVEEDDQGFLWVGTEEGLARWDGYRFRVYGADAGDPRRLAAGFVRALRRDAQGRLWIGTDSGGLARLDPADGGFTRVGGNLSVVGLAADRDGGMWVATTTGLLHVLSGDVVEQPWRHDAGTPEALPDPSVTAVLQRRSGDVWIGMAASLVVRHPDGRPGRTVELPGIEAGTPAGVNALYEDIDGRVWIGTALHGAYVWDPADAQVHRLRAMPGARAGEPPLDSDSVTAFAESAPGEVWVGTATRGLLVVEARTHVARRVMQDRAVPTGLQSNWVWALHRDRSGQMWIGSTSGLSRTRPREDAVLAIVPSEARGWSDPSVLAVEAAPDGVLTLGQHGGLVTVDPFARRITPLRARSQGEDDSPVFGYISAIARTADGRLFLGAKEGLFVRLPGAPRLQEWTLPQRQRVKGVNALLCDGQTLWIGGKFDGVWTMDLASAAHVVARPDVRGQLTDPQVNTLARAPDGAIWVGTKNGLNRLVPGQAIEQILSTPGDPATLPDGVVSALLFDRQGRLWVATNAGLAVMERRDGAGRPVFRRLGLAQGLTSLNVDKLLLDAQGRVWASTDDGLLVVDPATLAVRALHAAEGVAISTYWANSGAASADGSLLFFGGLGGL
ncbi:MAG TPA: two-component regulator propeller domain-containing protein, partial [Burkholderiaceae bacterium]